jgi:hypothetical protein
MASGLGPGSSGCLLFVELFRRPAPQYRQRLVAGNRQKPRGNLGSGLELGSLTPNVQEHLANEILGSRLVGDEAQQEPVDAHVVASEQNPHGMPVADGNRLDQS